jgi:hypothetical protein
MVNLTKRVAALQRAAGIGGCDDGSCICIPPRTFIQTYYPDHEQHPVERGDASCEACGCKKRLIVLRVEYDEPPDHLWHKKDLISPNRQ